MRSVRRLLWLLAGVMVLWCHQAVAQDDGVGLGLTIGAPTGLNAKVWLSRHVAIDGGFGWNVERNPELQVHSDVLWHNFRAFGPRLPLYYGVGGRLEFEGSNRFGIRVPIGLAYFLRIPADIFVEIVPVINVAPKIGLDINGGLGARFFFN